jgi:hypothetical protein
MGYPRSRLVDPDGGIYHVCSSCVRRAFLCGHDSATGFDFDHRRQWPEDRILALAHLFAVKLYGYAVMSNHYHVVLEVEPKAVSRWSEEEIADRWLNALNRPNGQRLHSNPKDPSVIPHRWHSRKPMHRMPNAGSANACQHRDGGNLPMVQLPHLKSTLRRLVCVGSGPFLLTLYSIDYEALYLLFS